MLKRHQDSDAVNAYLNSIGRYPLMTAEEEIRLGKVVQEAKELKARAAAGEELSREARALVRRALRAERRFVEANLRLVVSVAKKYMRGALVSLELLDLVQEGNTGLMRAVELFDATRGYKFSTYAYWWIRQAMSRAIYAKEPLMRLPQHLAEVILHRSLKVRSLDQTLEGAGELALGDSLADPNSVSRSDADWQLDTDMRLDKLRACLMKLEEKERLAIEARYGLDGGEPAMYQALGKRFGVTRERARQIVSRAETRLRLFMSSAAA